MNDLPSYLAASPVGFHVMDLRAFVQSPHKAPASSDPERGGWATEGTAKELSQLFPPTAIGISTFNLLIYNKSRDTDRICPACHRWYRVGETPPYNAETGVTTPYASFEEFIHRPAPETPSGMVYDDVVREQDLSGICSRICFATTSSGDESQFGRDTDEITPDQISRHSAIVERETGWSVRQTTAEEEASMGGVKLLYVKKD